MSILVLLVAIPREELFQNLAVNLVHVTEQNNIDVDPGPPCSHTKRGAVSEPCCKFISCYRAK